MTLIIVLSVAYLFMGLIAATAFEIYYREEDKFFSAFIVGLWPFMTIGLVIALAAYSIGYLVGSIPSYLSKKILEKFAAINWKKVG